MLSGRCVDDLAVIAVARLGGVITPGMRRRVYRLLPEGMRKSTGKRRRSDEQVEHESKGSEAGEEGGRSHQTEVLHPGSGPVLSGLMGTSER